MIIVSLYAEVGSLPDSVAGTDGLVVSGVLPVSHDLVYGRMHVSQPRCDNALNTLLCSKQQTSIYYLFSLFARVVEVNGIEKRKKKTKTTIACQNYFIMFLLRFHP